MSYYSSGARPIRRAAGYVDQILNGARPADIPVEQPTNWSTLALNRTDGHGAGGSLSRSRCFCGRTR